MSKETSAEAYARLADVMRALRDPASGCPWDLEQDFASIAPYTIEEAYEVADAIARDDMADLKGELGDLLLQVVYHSQMAAEAGHFTLADVTSAIADKMVRRHPHVFGNASVADADAQTAAWEDQKASERGDQGALAGVALGLPALMRAQKLQRRAARVASASTGPTRQARAPRSTRNSPRLRRRTMHRAPAKWVISCSPSSTTPVTSASTPRKRCVQRTPSSNVASMQWKQWPTNPCPIWISILSKPCGSA